jgi:hypothetical protein
MTRSALSLHAPRTRAVLWLFAMLWNLGGAFLGRADLTFMTIGLLAATFFAFLVARALLDKTIVSFADGRFMTRAGPLPPFRRFEHPIADIHAFVADVDDADEREGHAVFLVTRGSPVKRRVPLPLAGAQLHMRGAKRPFMGVVSEPRARVVADRLNEMLEDARRASSGYRVVDAVLPARIATDVDEPLEPDDVESFRSGKTRS